MTENRTTEATAPKPPAALPEKQPNLQTLEAWFDRRFLPTDAGGKQVWLRQEANEAWYRVRFGVAVDVWRFMVSSFLAPIVERLWATEERLTDYEVHFKSMKEDLDALTKELLEARQRRRELVDLLDQGNVLELLPRLIGKCKKKNAELERALKAVSYLKAQVSAQKGGW